MICKMTGFLTGVAVVAVLFAGAAPVEGGTVTYAFSVYENADSVNTSSVANISMELIDLGVDATSGKHLGLFKFLNKNAAPVTTKVGTVYFESGLSSHIQNLAFDSSNSSTGVDLSKAVGNTKTGGKLIPAWSDVGAYAFTKNGGQKTLEPGDMGAFSFELKSGASFTNLSNAIYHDGVSTSRVVVHLQALPGGSSVWAVTGPIPVPLPSAVWAGFGLLGALGLLRARRRKTL